MSYYFLFTSRGSSVLSSKFFPPIEINPNKQYCIGLVNFVCFNSIFNVTAQNNQFCYVKNSEKIKPLTRTTRRANNTFSITSSELPPGVKEENLDDPTKNFEKRSVGNNVLPATQVFGETTKLTLQKPAKPTTVTTTKVLPLVNSDLIDILVNKAAAASKTENIPPTTIKTSPVPVHPLKSQQNQPKPPLKYATTASTTDKTPPTVTPQIATSDLVKITIPPGAYEADNIRDYLRKHYDRHFDLRVNESMKTEVDSTYKIIWNPPDGYGIGGLLGFTGNEKASDSVKDGLWFWVSEKNINITNVTTINISCNLVNQTYLNGVSSHILHSFSLDVAPGYSIVETPHNIIYLPLIASTPRITEILLEVRDQNWKLIDFQNEEITVVLHLKEL
jgi:hypothetical protein